MKRQNLVFSLLFSIVILLTAISSPKAQEVMIMPGEPISLSFDQLLDHLVIEEQAGYLYPRFDTTVENSKVVITALPKEFKPVFTLDSYSYFGKPTLLFVSSKSIILYQGSKKFTNSKGQETNLFIDLLVNPYHRSFFDRPPSSPGYISYDNGYLGKKNFVEKVILAMETNKPIKFHGYLRVNLFVSDDNKVEIWLVVENIEFQ